MSKYFTSHLNRMKQKGVTEAKEMIWDMLHEAPRSHFMIPAHIFNVFNQCCVYVWMREGQALYVGRSTRGLARFIDERNHHVLRVKGPVKKTDTFDIYLCKKNQLSFSEKMLIQELRPIYNGLPVVRNSM